MPKKIGPFRKKYSTLKEKKIFFELRFPREYLTYPLAFLTSYCTNWRLYVFKISRDYLHLVYRKKLILNNWPFCSRTIARAKIIQTS